MKADDLVAGQSYTVDGERITLEQRRYSADKTEEIWSFLDVFKGQSFVFRGYDKQGRSVFTFVLDDGSKFTGDVDLNSLMIANLRREVSSAENDIAEAMAELDYGPMMDVDE